MCTVSQVGVRYLEQCERVHLLGDNVDRPPGDVGEVEDDEDDGDEEAGPAAGRLLGYPAPVGHLPGQQQAQRDQVQQNHLAALDTDLGTRIRLDY